MISLKDYAAQKKISYEAVRKSVSRYKAELDGHIFKMGRTQYLDDEAVAFLDEKRNKHPVVVIQQDKDAEIELLRQENNLLKNELIATQKELLSEKDKVAELMAKNQELLLGSQGSAEAEAATTEDSSSRKWWLFWK